MEAGEPEHEDGQDWSMDVGRQDELPGGWNYGHVGVTQDGISRIESSLACLVWLWEVSWNGVKS